MCGDHSSRWMKYKKTIRAVVVAQLVEWSLSTPEVHGSNPVIGKIYIKYLWSTVSNRQK